MHTLLFLFFFLYFKKLVLKRKNKTNVLVNHNLCCGVTESCLRGMLHAVKHSMLYLFIHKVATTSFPTNKPSSMGPHRDLFTTVYENFLIAINPLSLFGDSI